MVKRADVKKELKLLQPTKKFFLRIDYRGAVYRTANTKTNKLQPNKPEWNTSVVLDVYDENESLQIWLYQYQQTKAMPIGSCKLKLSDINKSGQQIKVVLDSKSADLYLAATYEMFNQDSDEDFDSSGSSP